VAGYFLDSSALVKRYVAEVGRSWIRGLLRPALGNDVIVSRITGAEVVAALVRHVPPLPPTDLRRALGGFRRHFSTRFRIVLVGHAVVVGAMLLAAKYRLRGYDAVQLAAAMRACRASQASGLPAPVLLSADVQLNNAAVSEGLVVDNPLHHP
jgi:predicted nucleic acid-binding protein